MRVNWNIIKIGALFGLVLFLYAFSSSRNSARKISDVKIEFVDFKYPFISEENVSKLLIQKNKTVANVPKDILDLNELEKVLKSNPIIKNAEVYMSVNGHINVEVEQKKPIARVSTNASYYIDDEGSYMPLSSNYTARVPLVTGQIEKSSLGNVYKVAKKIYNDEILKKHVIEIHQNSDKTISLKLRQYSFQINLGKVKHLDKKINNLKAFYQMALKEEKLSTYSKVNLQFDNQVVCTKK